MKAGIITIMILVLTSSFQSRVIAQDGPKDTFSEFINAQNQHDFVLLNKLLLDSQNFLWITKGQTIWGKDKAMLRFENLYNGTWTLTPEWENFKIITLDKKCRQIFIPISF